MRTLLPMLAFACTSSKPGTTTAQDTGFDPGPSPYTLDDTLRLTDVQALGTHNSTHIQPAEPIHPSHYYTQPALTDQLAGSGVRAMELDIHLHTELGFQVFHLPVVDQETRCLQFADCLRELKRWSNQNPWHLPLMIWMEPKDEDLDLAIPEYDVFMDKHDDWEAAVLDVIPRHRIFTPDDLRGDHNTLPEAIAADGWPTLGELRGKIIFSMLDSGDHRATYLTGATALEGRLFFVDSDDPSDPFAATFKVNNAAEDAERVSTLAQAGFLISSNVHDGPEHEQADGDAHFAASLAAGAHFLKSDRVTETDGWSTAIPDGNPARCNPITAPEACTAEEVEALP